MRLIAQEHCLIICALLHLARHRHDHAICLLPLIFVCRKPGSLFVYRVVEDKGSLLSPLCALVS